MPSIVVAPLSPSPPLAAPKAPLLAAPNLPLLDDLSINYFTPSTTQTNSILPSAYIWPEQDRPSSVHEYSHPPPTDIPVIDMEEGAHSIIKKLALACENWGVFYVVHHGVSLGLVESVRERALKLFSLPLETKIRALRKEGSFEGFGKAIIGKFFNSLMWSEGFTMMGHPSSSIADTTSKLCPNEENEFRGAFEEYDMAMRGMAAKLLGAILVGMGVEMGQFRCKQFDPESDCHGALQLNYYPPCPQPMMTMGLPAHTDSTCLTILHQGDVAGLEIYRHGQWTLVPPLQHSLVVHVGDMLQILSNGKYKSIVHRAIANKTRPRLSLVFLCGPPITATIAPPHEVVDSSDTKHPLYRPLKWVDYLQAKSKYFMDALDYFKDD